MISALDSSVILDVLTADPTFADASENVLREAATQGRLVVGECVLAEIRPAFESPDEMARFLVDWHLDFVPASRDSALLAGENFSAYLARGGQSGRIVADFLIGAHAQLHADRLVARDRGFMRDYFRELIVLDPSQAT